VTNSLFRPFLAVSVCLTLAAAFANPGDLDSTFGSGGIVISSHGGLNMFGPAVKIQPDGKIVVVGKEFNGHDDDLLVQRFLSNGLPDTTFGTSGATVIKLSSADDNAKGLAFQSDGKIIIAGGAGQPGSYETSVLVRVSADGVLDTSFGTGGKVLIDFGLPSHSHSVGVQSDGKIVVTGETYTTADGGLFATARVLANGVLDSSFGVGGKVTQAFGAGANAHSLVLQTDGKVLLGGYATNSDTGRAGFVVARLLFNGTLDTSFGSNGSSTVSVGTGNNYCHVLMLQSDGKIVLAGSAVTATNYDFSLVRFDNNGVLDTSFGAGGIVTTNFVSGPRPSADETAGGVIQADGKIIVGGYSERKFALARYLSSGALDGSFGTGGMVTTVVGTGNDDWIKSLALQSWDGKVVAAGYSKSGSTFNLSLARFSGESVDNPGFSLLVPQGWNLLGNGINQTVPVASQYGNSSWVNSVWKWDAAQKQWQFYTPTMDAPDLLNYAISKGYSVLSEIKPGEGYWVDAKISASVMTQSGDAINPTAASFQTGWNMVATGTSTTPSAFNASLSATPPAMGVVPSNITSLWAWDNPTGKWYFYASSLEAQGGTALADFTTSKGYLNFTSTHKALGPGVGFWVNRP
jgi:uncharacterized delta-60 repeat protein